MVLTYDRQGPAYITGEGWHATSDGRTVLVYEDSGSCLAAIYKSDPRELMRRVVELPER